MHGYSVQGHLPAAADTAAVGHYPVVAHNFAILDNLHLRLVHAPYFDLVAP